MLINCDTGFRVPSILALSDPSTLRSYLQVKESATNVKHGVYGEGQGEWACSTAHTS